MDNYMKEKNGNRRLRVLTWHIHGSYLYYLTQTDCTFYLPVKDSKEEGYGGASPGFPWGKNVIDIPAEKIKETEFDCILFQSKKAYLNDQYELLSDEQRRLPKIYLEHDPPREIPTDTKHIVDDPSTLLVHVTFFNRLMWDNNRTPTKVIEHGVTVDPAAAYTGELPKGIVVINGIVKRGRRLGYDVFERIRKKIPLDLVGMESEAAGGLGEIKHEELNRFAARYRFFFNPIRYTSLGLSVCEAMMTGLPVVGLATTEMATTIENGYSGYVYNDEEKLIACMQRLLDDPGHAKQLGEGAKAFAGKQFNIERFKEDWLNTIEEVVSQCPQPTSVLATTSKIKI